MVRVVLHGIRARGRTAVVDDEDYELVSQHRWHVKERVPRAGHRAEGAYAYTGVTRHGRKTFIAMHGLIAGFPMTDHVDRDTLNNRRSNLRPATAAQNKQNQRGQLSSTSAYKGVSWNTGRGRWQVSIRGRYVGLFDSEQAAAAAYDRAAAAAFGEYAYLNGVTS